MQATSVCGLKSYLLELLEDAAFSYLLYAALSYMYAAFSYLL
jgi:hypothetical protein